MREGVIWVAWKSWRWNNWGRRRRGWFLLLRGCNCRLDRGRGSWGKVWLYLWMSIFEFDHYEATKNGAWDGFGFGLVYPRLTMMTDGIAYDGWRVIIRILMCILEVWAISWLNNNRQLLLMQSTICLTTFPLLQRPWMSLVYANFEALPKATVVTNYFWLSRLIETSRHDCNSRHLLVPRKSMSTHQQHQTSRDRSDDASKV